jgi:hypothetical protein
MRVKVGNQEAVQYMIGSGSCQECAFRSKSLLFCESMHCYIRRCFYQTGTLEDIFKLWG